MTIISITTQYIVTSSTLVHSCLPMLTNLSCSTFHLNANLESNGSNRADILVTIKRTFKTGSVCFRSGKFLWGVAGTLSRRSSRWWSWSRSWPSGRSSEGSASKTSGPEKRAILVLGVHFLLHWNSLPAQFSIGHTPGIEPRTSASVGKHLSPPARLWTRFEQFLVKRDIVEAWFAYAILLLTVVNKNVSKKRFTSLRNLIKYKPIRNDRKEEEKRLAPGFLGIVIWDATTWATTTAI